MKDIGKHENVVQIYGCYTQSRPVCLVLEYAPGGNLLNYLRALKQQVITWYNITEIRIRALNVFSACFMMVSKYPRHLAKVDGDIRKTINTKLRCMSISGIMPA